MVRIAAILLAFAVCALAGAGSAARLTRRYAALRDTLAAGERVFGRVSATREPLRAALLAEPETGALAAYARALEEGKDEQTAAAAAVDRIAAPLTAGDRTAVTELLTAFSAVNVGQLNRRYTQAAARLTACVGEANDDQRGKAKLYRAMGVLFGAALAILLW